MTNPFQHNKMRWLNSVMYDCGVSAMSCCTAYAIADHLNSVSGDAWPSIERIANKLCVSTKTVRRSIRELERHGLLQVSRPSGRTRTNRYRPNLPPTVNDAPRGNNRPDNPEQKGGHFRLKKPDRHVSQSYLENLLTSYTKPETDESRTLLRDQGTYELRLTRRLGASGTEMLEQLAFENPRALTALCLAEKRGDLSDRELQAVISSILPLPGR
jgi:hypothetical protein